MSDLLRPNYTAEDLALIYDMRSRLNIAAAVIDARIVAGWSQSDLAAAAGTTQCRVSQLEASKGNPRFDTLDRIAKALGLALTLVPRAAARSTGTDTPTEERA